MTTEQVLKILIAEEQQSDIKLIESILKDSEILFEVRYAKSENDFVKYINRFEPDVIISGHNFTKFSVQEALEYIEKQALLIPFILLVSKLPEEILQDLLKKGVDDYITRYNLLQLPTMIFKAIESKRLRKEKAEAEETLKLKEARLKRFFENNHEAIFELGYSGEILEMNPVAEKTLDIRSKARLQKLKLIDCILKEDIKAFRDFYGMAFRGQKRELQFRLISGKDEIIWLDSKAIPIYDEQENISSILLIASNISEHKASEEQLLKTKTSYEAILQSIDEAIWSIDKNYCLSSFNLCAEKSFYTLFKTRLKIGMSISALHSLPSQYSEWRLRYEQAFEGKNGLYEDSFLVENEIRHFQKSLYGISIEGEIIGISIICKDITEYRRSEAKLKESETYFKLLAENAPTGIFKTDEKGMCTYANERMSIIAGTPQKETLGTGWCKNLHPADREKVYEFWNITVALGVEFNMEHRFLVNGKTTWVNCRAIAIKDQFGKLTGFIGTSTDITNLKNSIEENNEKQTILEAIENTNRMTFWSMENIEPYSGICSDSAYKIFEFEKNEKLTLEKIQDLVHPADRDIFAAKSKQVSEEGKSVKIEYRICLDDGRIKHLLSTCIAIKNSHGEVIKIVGATLDFTSEKEERSHAIEAETLLKESYEMAKMGAWEYDVLNSKMNWSEELKHAMGLKPEDSTPEFDRFLLDVHPDDRDKVSYFQNNQILNGASDFVEYRIVKNNTTRYYVQSSHGIRDSFGKIVKLGGLIMDVGENKTSATQLLEDADMFHIIFDHSPDALFVEDENGYILDVNIKACEIQNQKKEELIGKNILDLTPENDCQLVFNNFKRLYNGEINQLRSVAWNVEGKACKMEIKSNRITYHEVDAILLSVRATTEPPDTHSL